MRKGFVTLVGIAAAATLVWAGTAFGVGDTAGRFTGGGKFRSETGVAMTHGFELHCDGDAPRNHDPNNLEVNWEGGNHWHMEQLTMSVCSNRPNFDPKPPAAPSDVYNGEGYGRLNGVSGYFADWRIIDKGEPGTSDMMFIKILAPNGDLVIQTVFNPATDGGGDGTLLEGGNHQAHRDNK